MDNHPIPQDVTHFQFKLIGELTLKQFGYIAAGGILAWIGISLPTILIIKLLIAAFFAGTGLFFAFIPVESRPADLMLSYFFRALFQPNQYIFQKEGLAIDSVNIAKNQQVSSVQQQQTTVLPTNRTTPQVNQQTQKLPIQQPTLSVPQQIQIQSIMQTPRSSIEPNASLEPKQPIASNILSQQTPITTWPSKGIQSPTLSQQNQNATEASTTEKPSSNEPPATTLQNQLQDTLAQKQQLEEQLAKLQQQLHQDTPPSATNIPIQPQQNNTQSTTGQQAISAVSPVVKKIAPPQNTTKTIIASEFPNIIMGVVRDARGNVLPNILIEVKDADENPVRAFKTNALGQFASATPLLNGAYTVVFEDPEKKHRFDAVQVEAAGYSMQPIEIVSLDQREELRKELFG